MNNEEKFQAILNDVSSDPERRSQAILVDVSGHSTIYEYESSRCEVTSVGGGVLSNDLLRA